MRHSIARLKSLELFTGCGRTQFATIDGLATTLDLEPGVALCTEHYPGAEFFVLLSGLVEVRNEAGIAAILRPGAWFGETALIDLAPRRATVTARTPVAVLVFGKREFKRLLALSPHIRNCLEHTAAQVVAGDGPCEQPWYQPLPGGSSTMTISFI
jgi:CRP-like cAMP-binding protein